MVIFIMREGNFQIDLQKFKKYAAHEVFTDCDETKEESKGDDDDIDYDQAPWLVNSKLLLAKTIQVACFLFWQAYIQRGLVTR